jgi:hypothetical protein
MKHEEWLAWFVAAGAVVAAVVAAIHVVRSW